MTSRDDLDVTDQASVRRAIRKYRPWAVINTAGFVRVADAEMEADACHGANALGAENLAQACAEAGIKLVTFSSDLVFDGLLGRAYRESDAVCPVNVYGKSKATAEAAVSVAGGGALIVRTSAFFGPWDRYNFAWNVLDQLSRGEPVLACRKTRVSPTYVPDLVHATLDLLIDDENGIWHLANQGELSWYDFARRIADGAGYGSSLVLPLDSQMAATTALTSEKGLIMRSVDHAIDDFLRDVGELGQAAEMSVAAE